MIFTSGRQSCNRDSVRPVKSCWNYSQWFLFGRPGQKRWIKQLLSVHVCECQTGKVKCILSCVIIFVVVSLLISIDRITVYSITQAVVVQGETFSRTQPLKEWKRTSISPSSSCKHKTHWNTSVNIIQSISTFKNTVHWQGNQPTCKKSQLLSKTLVSCVFRLYLTLALSFKVDLKLHPKSSFKLMLPLTLIPKLQLTLIFNTHICNNEIADKICIVIVHLSINKSNELIQRMQINYGVCIWQTVKFLR